MTFFFYDDIEVDKMMNRLTKEFGYLDFQVMKDSYRPARWIEIISKDITKYTALQKISEIENIDNNNIIAFGDSFNDLDMIQKCGTGVAVSNAIPILKEEADYITLSNDENGVIHFLKNNLAN